MSKYTGGSPTIQCTPYKRKSLRSKFFIEHRSFFQKQARTSLQRGVFLGKLWQEYPSENVSGSEKYFLKGKARSAVPSMGKGHFVSTFPFEAEKRIFRPNGETERRKKLAIEVFHWMKKQLEINVSLLDKGICLNLDFCWKVCIGRSEPREVRTKEVIERKWKTVDWKRGERDFFISHSWVAGLSEAHSNAIKGLPRAFKVNRSFNFSSAWHVPLRSDIHTKYLEFRALQARDRDFPLNRQNLHDRTPRARNSPSKWQKTNFSSAKVPVSRALINYSRKTITRSDAA